jgi:hypothetical protein
VGAVGETGEMPRERNFQAAANIDKTSRMTDPFEVDIASQPVSLAEFLESRPPGSIEVISDATESGDHQSQVALKQIPITLECNNDDCKGPRKFDRDKGTLLLQQKSQVSVLNYTCRHCLGLRKMFAVRMRLHPGSINEAPKKQHIIALKMGEWPEFGFETPARVASLVGPDLELYFKGRLAESRNLGIGACVYYRRVVERQKNRLFKELIRFVQATSGDTQLVKELGDAQKETQFATSFGRIKKSLPESMMINGENPLQLLHTALSIGVHEMDDKECLQVAQDIRHVLFSMMHRMHALLKDEHELKAAASRLAALRNRPQQSN